MEKETEGLCKITGKFLKEHFDEDECHGCEHFRDCIGELGVENLFKENFTD